MADSAGEAELGPPAAAAADVDMQPSADGNSGQEETPQETRNAEGVAGSDSDGQKATSDGEGGRREEEEAEVEEEEEEEEEDEWMLGFVELAEDAADLLRHRFPSKLGGRPAWLDPLRLPSPEQLTCGATGRPLDFLLQVYAPVETNAAAFHRTLFVFTTPEGDSVHKPGAVRVLRCQLPRENSFYASEPAEPGDLAPPSLPVEEMARLQKRDRWRSAEAEVAVAVGDAPAELEGVPMWPEREIVVEPEADAVAGATQDGIDEEVKRLMRQYKAQKDAGEALTEEELPAEIMDTVEASVTDDRQRFAAFTARVAAAPEQVLRYCFEEGARPLWPQAGKVPRPADIPPCPACGGPRRFEFQILPQLLHFLNIDIDADAERVDKSLDWSTIAIYSCRDSCSQAAPAEEGGSAYVEEFAWVQPA
eukprot:jgi/Tetstr1/427166/TSEL_017354.t1